MMNAVLLARGYPPLLVDSMHRGAYYDALNDLSRPGRDHNMLYRHLIDAARRGAERTLQQLSQCGLAPLPPQPLDEDPNPSTRTRRRRRP